MEAKTSADYAVESSEAIGEGAADRRAEVEVANTLHSRSKSNTKLAILDIGHAKTAQIFCECTSVPTPVPLRNS